MKLNILMVVVLLCSVILSGCRLDVSGVDLVMGFWKSNDDMDSIYDKNIRIYSDEDRRLIDSDYDEVLLRFDRVLSEYSKTVDDLWTDGDFYRTNVESISPKETLIDFYLFLEYHRDTQLRNLSFPSVVRDELLLVEIMFVDKAIKHVENLDLGDNYLILKEDLLSYAKKLFREQLINILYEGKNQLDVDVRIPTILSRYDEIFINSGLHDKVRIELGVPDSVISRGMGLDLVTLYSGMGDYDKYDVKKLAIILTLEMKISGANMKLEKFFHVASSIDGLGDEINELKKDVELINLTGELMWVKTRMENSIKYLDKIYSFYIGEIKNVDLKDIFIELDVREDFYALGMLSSSLKEVMDNEDYWNEMINIKNGYKERYNGL